MQNFILNDKVNLRIGDNYLRDIISPFLIIKLVDVVNLDLDYIGERNCSNNYWKRDMDNLIWEVGSFS